MKQAMAFVLGLLLIPGTASAAEKDDKGKGGSGDDGTFVMKASASDLAEINLSGIAVKNASSDAVKKFAQKMIDDHTKTSKELASLAGKKNLKLAKEMDDKHRKLFDKLAKLSGSELDKAYMDGQVKDHEMAVSLFEKEAKNGHDEDLRKWAKDTLPALKEHLRMAREARDKVKGGK